MNAQEHYLDAERLLTYAADATAGSAEERYYSAVAQVHATLAVAASLAPVDVTIKPLSGWEGAEDAIRDEVADIERTRRMTRGSA